MLIDSFCIEIVASCIEIVTFSSLIDTFSILIAAQTPLGGSNPPTTTFQTLSNVNFSHRNFPFSNFQTVALILANIIPKPVSFPLDCEPIRTAIAGRGVDVGQNPPHSFTLRSDVKTSENIEGHVVEDFKPIRVEPADPTRCQRVGANGEQCPFQGMADPSVHWDGFSPRTLLKFCPMHGGVVAKSMKVQAKRTYLLVRWQAQHDHFIDPEVGVNLDEELAILRMTLQLMLNKYEEVELLTNAAQLQSLIRDIRDTLTANKKLKSQMGQLLDRAAMHNLCDEFIKVIGKHVPPEKLDLVSQEIAEAIGKAVASRVEGP